MIYFISVNDTYVKIGYARNVQARLGDLQVSSPYDLNVLKVTEGSMKDESIIHQKFKHLRKRGEWFFLVPELQRFIESCDPVDATLTIRPATVAVPENYGICQAVGCGGIFKSYSHKSNGILQKYCSQRCGNRQRKRNLRALNSGVGEVAL